MLLRWRIIFYYIYYGPVAQLGERRVRNAEVKGSIPSRSTSLSADGATSAITFVAADIFISCLMPLNRKKPSAVYTDGFYN